MWTDDDGLPVPIPIFPELLIINLSFSFVINDIFSPELICNKLSSFDKIYSLSLSLKNNLLTKKFPIVPLNISEVPVASL